MMLFIRTEYNSTRHKTYSGPERQHPGNTRMSLLSLCQEGLCLEEVSASSLPGSINMVTVIAVLAQGKATQLGGLPSLP